MAVSRRIRPLRTGLLQHPDNSAQDDRMVVDLDLLRYESAFEDEREIYWSRFRNGMLPSPPKKGKWGSTGLVRSTT